MNSLSFKTYERAFFFVITYSFISYFLLMIFSVIKSQLFRTHTMCVKHIKATHILFEYGACCYYNSVIYTKMIIVRCSSFLVPQIKHIRFLLTRTHIQINTCVGFNVNNMLCVREFDFYDLHSHIHLHE